MTEKRNFRGVWIPADIWLNKDLTLQEKVMLIEIDSLQDEVRGCYKSNSGFAEFFGLSVSRISRIISSLEEKGYIRVEQIRQGRSIVERRIFIITNLSKPPKATSENDTDKVLQKQHDPIAETTRTLLPKRHEPYCGNDKESNTYKGNTVEEKQTGDSPLTPRAEKPQEITSRFERFYSAYPRKQNRAAAERAFKKLNPDDELLETMITAIENQKKSESWSNGYVPHPSTWINGRRWEDEIQVEYTGEQKEIIDCYNDAVGDELGFIDPDIFSEARAVRINTFMGLSEKPKFWKVYFEYVRDNCSMPPSVGFDYLISPDGFNKIKGGQHERK